MKAELPLKKIHSSCLYQRKKKLVLLDEKRYFKLQKSSLKHYLLRYIEALNARLIWDIRHFLWPHLCFRGGETEAQDSSMNLYEVLHIPGGELVQEARFLVPETGPFSMQSYEKCLLSTFVVASSAWQRLKRMKIKGCCPQGAL